MEEKEIKELRGRLEHNIAVTEQLAKDMRKMRRHYMWQSVGNVLKLLIILTPLVVGYFYARPYFGQIQNAYDQVQELKGSIGEVQQNVGKLQGAAGDIEKYLGR